MKKTLAIILCALLSLSLFACGNEAQKTTNPATQIIETTAPVNAETQAVPATDAPTEAPTTPAVTKLSPLEAVNIYLDNASLWEKDAEEFYMAGFYYLFLDLDFDGVSELVTTEVQGTGRFSTNRYFRINENKEIEEIEVDTSIGDSSCDFFMDDSPVLLKNNSTGEYKYIVKDYIRAGGGMDFTAERELAYADGKISETNLFSYERIDEAVSGTGETQEFYKVYSLENKDVDKSEYETLRNEYFAEYTDLDLEVELVDGYEYYESEDKFNLLYDAYTDFEYDGFNYHLESQVD